ncbi:uncharacterized protein NFIA_044850 [Aspergillus fischeri NRRL 181]|uniref:Uncharacterized protein n=1 Tax=Neosartorya fischeri (strain ATCC 1020 / DSM 3700 / CBS 544.65 / FGSC A1164 / JCM 1740 / NRRL 181 / WB 181) TaxID=331117 RepID=A1CV89_NEOFI|nr:uncharacterized protein NFIA_044850 [Aspergillus fischeri NRRL 181]EAW25666.1 hypothetical protein NFIA_044850 [Aspergillus fischeri NRRL 181]KAG2009218.1 hypothetical protein GB937_007814 [Aspergillus fischeri]
MSAVAKSEHEECEASVDHHDAISYQDSERSIFDGGWEPDAAQPELTDLVFEMRELNKCIKLGLARLQAQEHAADKEKDLQRQERVWREYELNSRLEGMPQGLHDLPHLTGEHLESISRYFLAILGGSTELIDLKRKNDTWSDYCRNPDVFSGLAVVLNPTPQTHKSPTRTGVEVNTIERGDSRPIEVPIVKATLLQKAKEKWLASVSGVTVALQSYSDNIKWQRVTWDFRDSSVCAASVSLYYEDNRSKKGEWLLQHTSRILLSSQNRENLSFSVSAGQPADNLHISYNVYLPSWDLPPVKTQVW